MSRRTEERDAMFVQELRQLGVLRGMAPPCPHRLGGREGEREGEREREGEWEGGRERRGGESGRERGRDSPDNNLVTAYL